MRQPKMRMLFYFINVPVAGVGSDPTPANPNREYLRVENQGANPVTLVIGGKATATTPGFVIAANGSLTFDQVIPIEALSFFSTLGTTVVVIEGNPPVGQGR